MYVYLAFVIGDGPFPLEMLQLEQCFPIDKVDQLLNDSHRVVTLGKHLPEDCYRPDKMWNVEKWAALGWEFHHHSTFKI